MFNIDKHVSISSAIEVGFPLNSLKPGESFSMRLLSDFLKCRVLASNNSLRTGKEFRILQVQDGGPRGFVSYRCFRVN